MKFNFDDFDKDADNWVSWTLAWIIVYLMLVTALAAILRLAALDPLPLPPVWGIAL